jgi:hypothetical protein
MNNLIADHSQLVEAQIISTPGYGATFVFQDIPNIAKGNIELYGIEAYSADQMAFAPSGLEVIDASDVPNISYTLVTTDSNYKQVENQPYYNAIRSLNGGFIVLLNNMKIDLTKCYITILDAGGLQVNQTCVFNLYYNLIQAEAKNR